MTEIITWNVNGIRAAAKKGFNKWLNAAQPDIICLQEIKASEEQTSSSISTDLKYKLFVSESKRAGYSGTAVLSKTEPLNVTTAIGIEKFDNEGRTGILDFGNFVLINSYYPNGRDDLSRIPFKLEYYDAVMETAKELTAKGKNIILTGDFNTAHKEIDLARPAQNVKNTGFRPEERKKLDELVSKGFVDTFRMFNKSGGNYSWWSYRARARDRNVGWRLDYFFVNEEFKGAVLSSSLLTKTTGSDHCPARLVIDP